MKATNGRFVTKPSMHINMVLYSFHRFLTLQTSILTIALLATSIRRSKSWFWNVLFLHYGRVHLPFLFKYLSVSTYFNQVKRLPKDWRNVLAILEMNITILCSKVQCFHSFLLDSAFLPLQCSRVQPNPLSNWLMGTPQSQQRPLRSNPHLLFKKAHASRKNFWSRFIVTKWLFNSFFAL